MSRRCWALPAFLLLATSLVRASDDSVARVKALYDAAAYDEALKAIEALDLTASAPQPPVEVFEYRALSLLALERRPEAEGAIESLLLQDANYQVSAEAPPRWRAAVEKVRARMWVATVRERYAVAKAAFDGHTYAAAAEGFETVARLLATPPAAADEFRAGLGDLATVTDGFLELSRARLQANAPADAAATAPTLEPAAASAPPIEPAADVPAGSPRLYTNLDEEVVPPVALRQELPRWRRTAATPLDGAIEIIIDENGAVEHAAITTDVDPAYATQLLNAVRKWRFAPALKDGAPVKYGKNIRLRSER